MLTLCGLCPSGEVLSLPVPLYVELCRDEGAPADSLRVLFPGNIESEIAEIYVKDGDKEIFCGVVDEQIFISYETDRTEIAARSMAAVLLDNEACPKNFLNPCTQVLFERYMEPFGIKEYIGKDKILQGSFDVTKGMSCWQVAEKFGKAVFGVKPRISGKTILFDSSREEQMVFSTFGEGILFTGFEHSLQRCKLLSKVRAKTKATGDYDTVVANSQAVSSGVVRERYLDVSPFSGEFLASAYNAVEKSLESSRIITLNCPLQLAGVLGAKAKIKGAYGVYDGLCVKSLRYVQSGGDEYTRVTLWRKEN